MPIVSPLNIESTLSVIWTHERLVSEIRTVVNELDNERVQDSNIRNHINICLSNIAELLNMAKSPTYGVSMQGTLDSMSPLPYINLTVPVALQVNGQAWQTTLPSSSSFSPYSLIWEIDKVGYVPQGGTGLRNCQKLSQEEIMHLNGGENMQATQHVSWNVHGGRIYFWIGQEVAIPSSFWLFGFRNPILDDLRPYADSVTWRKPIDLPDRHVRLLVLMAQKMVLEQVNKQVNPEIEQNIQAMTAQITQQIVSETQFAEMQRTKKEYGLNNR